MKKLRITPRQARIYLFFALLLIVAPTIMFKLLPSHAGKVLVASPVSNDPNFARTLVYMQSHHGYGATGYILNKPLDVDNAGKIKSRFPFARDDQFFFGGPVGVGQVFFFILPKDEDWNQIEILNVDDLQNDNPERYNALIGDLENAGRIRILSGYSGWRGFQLNREIVRGGWDILPYDGTLIKGLSQEESWRGAVERVVRAKKVKQPII